MAAPSFDIFPVTRLDSGVFSKVLPVDMKPLLTNMITLGAFFFLHHCAIPALWPENCAVCEDRWYPQRRKNESLRVNFGLREAHWLIPRLGWGSLLILLPHWYLRDKAGWWPRRAPDKPATLLAAFTPALCCSRKSPDTSRQLPRLDLSLFACEEIK